MQKFHYQKIAVTALGIVLSTAVLSACDKKHGTSGGDKQVIAVTPLDRPADLPANLPAANCGQAEILSLRQVSHWRKNRYGRLGISPYGYNHSYESIAMGPYANANVDNGFCGCPIDTQAMCDREQGLVCIPSNALYGQNIAWWSFRDTGFTFSGYSGYDDIYNNPRFYARVSYRPTSRLRHRVKQSNPKIQLACTNRLGQTCQVGISSCGGNSVCSPLAPQSAVGVCTR